MSQKYYLLKRDLFECPGHQGYTGIRDKAGLYDFDEIKRFSEIMTAYTPEYHGSYAIKQECAPEFTNACFDDLARAHLREIIATKDAEIARLQAEKEQLIYLIRRSREELRQIRCKDTRAVCDVTLQLDLRLALEALDVPRTASQNKKVS